MAGAQTLCPDRLPGPHPARHSRDPEPRSPAAAERWLLRAARTLEPRAAGNQPGEAGLTQRGWSSVGRSTRAVTEGAVVACADLVVACADLKVDQARPARGPGIAGHPAPG